MSTISIHIIVNPTAGGGRAGQILPQLRNLFREKIKQDYLLHITGAPHDATHLARKASEDGAELIIAVGGDGTVHEIVNGMFLGNVPVNSSCALGILDIGTGKGLAQTLGLPRSIDQQLDLIIHSPVHAMDAALVKYTGFDGMSCESLFISECQIGIGSEVANRVHSRLKCWGGKIAFGTMALIETIFYKANKMSVKLDNNLQISEKLIGLVIGNGKYCAGGMMLTPTALLDDGFLDILKIHNMNIPQRLSGFSKIYSGNHIHASHFILSQHRSVRISSDEDLLVEADGEMLGLLPCEISIIPATVNVRCKSMRYEKVS